MSDPTPNPVKAFLGVAMLCVGGMMVLLFGTCTVAVVIPSLFAPPGPPPGPEDWTSLFMTLGTVPPLIGLMLALGGIAMLRSAHKRDSKTKPGDQP